MAAKRSFHSDRKNFLIDKMLGAYILSKSYISFRVYSNHSVFYPTKNDLSFWLSISKCWIWNFRCRNLLYLFQHKICLTGNVLILWALLYTFFQVSWQTYYSERNWGFWLIHLSYLCGRFCCCHCCCCCCCHWLLTVSLLALFSLALPTPGSNLNSLSSSLISK